MDIIRDSRLDELGSGWRAYFFFAVLLISAYKKLT